jgi:hypothetical protein
MNDLTELVVDVSKYQELIKPDEMQLVSMIIVRLAGGLTEDPRFRQHADSVLSSAKKLGVYAWDDPNITSQRQVDAWLNFLKPYEGYIHSIYPDYEQWWSIWGEWYQALQQKLAWNIVQKFDKTKLSLHYETTSTCLQKSTQIKQAPYTSKGFVDSYAPGMNKWLNKYPNWVAQYGYQPSKVVELEWEDLIKNWLPKYQVSVPVGTQNLIGHQFTGDRCKLPGMYDAYNRRSPADVSIFSSAWLGDQVHTEYPNEIPVEEVPLFKGAVQILSLNIRSEPSASARDVGDLLYGSEINIYETAIKETWYRIGENQWVAGIYKGQEFVKPNQ